MPADIIASSLSSLVDEYYEKKILAEAEIQNDLLKYGVKAMIPKGNSRTIHWNRWSKFGRAQTVTDGTDLSTPETPAVTEVRGTLELFGDYVSVSPYGDEIRIASAIDESYNKFIEQISREANMRLQDVMIDGDSSSGNSFPAATLMYAGNAGSFSELESGGNYKLTNKDIQRAVGRIRKAKKKGRIICLMNAYGHEDLMIHDDDFRNLVKNQDLAVLKTNELPQWAGAKLGWLDDPWREDLASAGGAAGTYSASGAVLTTWIFAEEAFGTVQLMGRGGLRPRFKVQDITRIGVEVTVGYFIPFKGGVLNADWIIALRHVATNPEVSGIAAS